MGGDPDRRRPVAHRAAGPSDAPSRREVLAPVIDRALGRHQQAHHLEPLLEPGEGVGVGHAEGRQVERLARPHAEQEPAPGEVVERQRRLRQRGRMAPHHVGDADAEADLARRAGGGGDDRHRVEPDVRADLARGRLRHEVGRPDAVGEPVEQVVGPPDGVEALLLAALRRRRGRRPPEGAPRPSPTAPVVRAPTWRATYSAPGRGPTGAGRPGRERGVRRPASVTCLRGPRGRVRGAARPRGRRSARPRPSRRGPRPASRGG